MPIRAIIWDLDDTLFSERSFAFSGFAAVAAAFESLLGPPDEAAARMRDIFDAGDRRHVFDRVLTERGLAAQPETIADMIRVYRGHAPSIRLYDDADRALTRLRPNFRFGLITDGPAEMQRGKVAAMGLAAHIEQIILTAELPPGHGKPDPLAFEMIATRLAVTCAECVYVADNAAKDFIAPNRLGWTTVQITRPDGVYRNTPPAPDGRPQATITSLDQLDAVLEA